MNHPIFDECAYMHLCATGQVDNLPTFLEVEKRYRITGAECSSYRRALDTAASSAQANEGGGATTSSSNTDWRYRISRWMLKASDDFSISRGTAIMALSYFDRFFLGKEITKQLFQVVSVTCLFVACKLFERIPMKLASLMNYTHGKFDRSEVLSMEGKLVASLWLGSYVYPPTAGSFALMFMSDFRYFPLHVPSALEICQFIIELAACDFYFVAHMQSKVAVAAIIVTLEQMNASPELIRSWLSNIKAFQNGVDDHETLACVKHLRKIYNHNQNRIKELDGISSSNDIITIAKEQLCENKRIGRVATPSPTPDDEPAVKRVVVGYSEIVSDDDRNRGGKKSLINPLPTPTREDDCIDENNNIDSGQRKRQRCAISCNKCTIN